MSSSLHLPLRHVRTACSLQGAGPPILLIHGAEATRSSFDGLAALLARSMTVCSYDQRQCGDSEGDAEPASILDLVDDAADLIDALALERPTVLGTSFGGRIAQGLAIRHPARVERLVLCNTWPLDLSLEAANPLGVARLAALRAALPESARELAEAYYGREHVARHPELPIRFARGRAAGGSGARTALVRSVLPLPCERIAAPTLLVSGSADAVVPAALMPRMHERIAGSAWAGIEGASHAITVERPAAVAQAIGTFLQEASR